MEIRSWMQRLRDDCEECSRLRAERGDRDSADAYERIGIALDDLQRAIAADVRVIEARRGLFSHRQEVPKDHPVQPLRKGQRAKDKMTCGHCGRSWDDAIVTSYTPAPSGRCPFEDFHSAEEC